jgi:hypothetical protein
MADEKITTVDKSVLLYRLIENGTRIIMMAMKCATILGLAYCTYLSIDTLAGRATNAQISIIIGYLTETNEGVTVVAALLTGTVGVLFGFLQWHLKRRVIQAFSNYRVAIEGPDRTSSMLDEFGQTHPRDR